MAGNKTTRKKKGGSGRRMSKHIAAVLNHVMDKFYIMGDMNHSPTSFHTSGLNLHLKGMDLVIALQEMMKFLYGERKQWTFAVYHFFKIDGKIEVIPSLMRIDDSLLNEVADNAEDNIKLLKDSVMDEEEGLTEENYIFYGYYINYGEHLRMDLMEQDIITALMKVNGDLVSVNPEVETCTAEKILRSISNEKFSLVNSNSLKTDYVEKVPA